MSFSMEILNARRVQSMSPQWETKQTFTSTLCLAMVAQSYFTSKRLILSIGALLTFEYSVRFAVFLLVPNFSFVTISLAERGQGRVSHASHVSLE